MKTALFGITAALAVIAGVIYFTGPTKTQTEQMPTHVYDSWVAWKKRYGKDYGQAFAEETYRIQVYYRNYKKVMKLNREEFTARFNLNEFADLPSYEFARIYSRYTPTTKLRERKPVVLDESNLKDSVNWVAYGAVPRTKHQGQCGSCWAFSAVSAIESANFLQKSLKVVPTYSEQQLVDCTGKSFGNNGCNGGNTDNAFTYVIDFPLQTEDDYPYRGQEKTCRHGTGSGTVTDFTDVEQNSVSQLKAAINKQPVSIAVEAHRPVFQFYMGGVITSKSCGQKLNHGVVAVGYDKDFNGQEFFYVRNSWGEDWGENGYLKISTSSDNICGILSNPSYPTA